MAAISFLIFRYINIRTEFFCSSYWLESYDGTSSSFKNMGLWEFCFKNLRYPYYQFEKLFDGCHNVFSEEYYVIREWLLPGWLLVIQSFVTVSFLLSFSGQAILVMILVRFPLKFVLKNEWILSSVVCVCNSITSELNF